MKHAIAFAKDIKLSHTVFALPFAASAILTTQTGWPTLDKILYLFLAMFGARTFAMGMNRYLDADIDAQNPRTKYRAIPAGVLTPYQTLSYSLLAAVIFILAAFGLNPLSGLLALPVLGILAGYSMMKRMSWMTHWYLGVCLGLAPVAVAIALDGQAQLVQIFLGLAVALWTAGFDILYSLQDSSFDQRQGLKSVPSRFSPFQSLWLSRLSFVGMILCLLKVGALWEGGLLYNAGVGLIAIILIFEHWLVKDAAVDGSSKNLDAAFFNVNGWVGVVFFLMTQLDLWIRTVHGV
ncbi:MAG: UbiA-like polyprenyltransferase [Oligoflexales bacterium]